MIAESLEQNLCLGIDRNREEAFYYANNLKSNSCSEVPNDLGRTYLIDWHGVRGRQY